MKPSQDDPLHPIKLQDYPKLFDFVLTVDGLKYFQELKRKFFLRKNLTIDECNKLRLLYVYYSTSNKNIGEVAMWQKICVTLDEQGILEKNMLASKENLIHKSLIMKNPEYVEGLYKTHIDFVKNSRV